MNNNSLRVNTDVVDDDDMLDPHPTVSPETPAESFFISPELRTNNVSAFALAQQLRSNAKSTSRSVRSGASTVATDDFQSAHEAEVEFEFAPESTSSLFGKDILVLSRSPIPEDDHYLDTYQDARSTSGIMAKKTTKPVTTTTAPSTTTTTDEGPNAAQVVYEKAKDVWTWGKGLPIVGFFETITETVATKVVSVAGTSLPEIDNQIKPQLAGLDTSYLNPAIEAIVSALMKGVSSTEATFRPVIQAVVPTVLGPLGMIESDKKKDDAPEVTAPATPVAMN